MCYIEWATIIVGANCSMKNSGKQKILKLISKIYIEKREFIHKVFDNSLIRTIVQKVLVSNFELC